MLFSFTELICLSLDFASIFMCVFFNSLTFSKFFYLKFPVSFSVMFFYNLLDHTRITLLIRIFLTSCFPYSLSFSLFSHLLILPYSLSLSFVLSLFFFLLLSLLIFLSSISSFIYISISIFVPKSWHFLSPSSFLKTLFIAFRTISTFPVPRNASLKHLLHVIGRLRVKLLSQRKTLNMDRLVFLYSRMNFSFYLKRLFEGKDIFINENFHE